MTNRSLLVEVFVEELPPKALNALGNAFAFALNANLSTLGLVSEGSVVTSFASPRRLAAHITGVMDQAAPKAVTHKLMPVSVGLDAGGQATVALTKKLAALGFGTDVVPQLIHRLDGKVDSLFLEMVQPGSVLGSSLQAALEDALARLPIPKVMQYQLDDGWSTVNFVRPAHGLLALHGPDVVPVKVLGLASGRKTHGHRFEAATDPIDLIDADSYASQLRDQGAVIAGFGERRAEISRQLQAKAVQQGLVPIADDALLDEVTALVERPNVLLCSFESEYLEVPPECLILTMKANQKYFPLLDGSGKLTNRFLVVSNISPADPSRVISGNERVVRPRLADAKFFFDQDRKHSLESRLPGLEKVVYHGKLGTLGQRMRRVAAIAKGIGDRVAGPDLGDQAAHCARLAKADLLTEMVGEFPELQGIMGGYYARHDGLPEATALAIEDHYKPRFAGDVLPRNQVGMVVALADKLEALVGLFGIGQRPSGDKDPYALRRHALGVVRILVENRLSLEVSWLIEIARRAFEQDPGVLPAAPPTGEAPLVEQVEAFLRDRLSGMLQDHGAKPQDVEAVMSLQAQRLSDIPDRLAAVQAFRRLPESASLAAANKRVGNILRKSEGTEATSSRIRPELLVEPEEVELAAALARVAPVADAAFLREDYTASLQALAALRNPVDGFFEAVMVNADDPLVRLNRLALLRALHGAMNRVADLSKLSV